MHFPSKKELLVLGLVLFVFMFFQAFKMNGDSAYGYPITEKIMHPSYYPNDDLVVGAASGNFLFYRLLAHFPLFTDNFFLRDFILSIPLTILLILGWYNIFFELSNDRKFTIISIFFLLFSDGKLFLHGYPLPFFTLTSIGSVLFLQIFAFYFYLKDRMSLSFSLLALSSYLHPAAGFSIFGTLGILFAIKSIKEKKYIKLVKAFALPLLIILPSIYLVGKKFGMDTDIASFVDVFYRVRSFSAVFIDDYFSRTYLYTLGSFSLILYLNFKGKINFNHHQKVINLMIAGFIGSFFWLINSYFFHYLPFFYTLYIARIFYLIEPLTIFILLYIIHGLLVNEKIIAKVLAALLVLSMVTMTSFQGFIVLLAVFFFYVFEERIKFNNLFFSNIKINKFNENKLLKVFIVFAVIATALIFGYARGNKYLKFYKFIRGENTFNFSFDANKNYALARTRPLYSELLDWAKQIHGNMFLLPLDGDDDYDYFRYITKNGSFITTDDLGQLGYSPKYFMIGFDRLNYLGVRLEGNEVWDYSGYERLDLNNLKKMGINYAIFNKYFDGFRRPSQGFLTVFENDQFLVYLISPK